MKKKSLVACFESDDETIIIGAPQSLITLNDSLGAIETADASATGIVPPAAADLITVNDAMKGIVDGDPVVPEAPVAENTPEAIPEAPVVPEESIVPEEPVEVEEPVVPEESALDDTVPVDDPEVAAADADDSDIELDGIGEEEANLELPSDDEDLDLSDLDEADEPEEEAGDDEEKLAALNEVHKSLESISGEVHASIRRGGLTVAQAKVKQDALMAVYHRIGMSSEKYVMSHESFGTDAIAVTMEADRSISESIREVIAKIIAALKAAYETASNFVKALVNVAAKLKSHSLAMYDKVKILKYSEEHKTKKVEVSKFAKKLGVHGKSTIDPEESIRFIIEGGVKLTAFTNETSDLATKIKAGIATYKHGDYVAMFESAVSKIVDDNSPMLPGGKGISKDDTNMIKIIQKDPELEGTFEVLLPAPTALTVICESVNDVSTFVNTYGALVLKAEASIKDLVEGLETDESSGAAEFIKDSKAIMDHIRGCSASYIRFALSTSEAALNYVAYCVKQY